MTTLVIPALTRRATYEQGGAGAVSFIRGHLCALKINRFFRGFVAFEFLPGILRIESCGMDCRGIFNGRARAALRAPAANSVAAFHGRMLLLGISS